MYFSVAGCILLRGDDGADNTHWFFIAASNVAFVCVKYSNVSYFEINTNVGLGEPLGLTLSH